eukprot:scaffold48097_cov21-Tisochrysis_lutea.AAC.2
MSSGELPKALSGGERHEEAELDLPAHTKKDLAAVDSALSTSIHLWLRRRRKNVVGILCAVVHRKRGEKRKGKWLHCCTCLQGSEEADEQPLSVELTHCNGTGLSAARQRHQQCGQHQSTAPKHDQDGSGAIDADELGAAFKLL